MGGVVLTKGGAPLPGATVTITNPSLGVSMGAVTDAKGEFRIAPLASGKGYSLVVSFPSMATVKLDVEVMVGRITTVPVTLRPASEVVERVKVTARSDVVNTESTTTQTNFSAEFIDALPILGRNYQDVLTLAPGVTDVNGTGNPSIHGSRDTDVVTLVDGVSTTDPVTGKRGQELNIASIQEIEVKTSGATAEYGRAQGGFVNVVTRSGGNEFEGKFSFYWRSNIFDGQGAGIDDARLHGGAGENGLRNLQFNDYLPFLSLAGPIKKDRAWYYITGEYIQKQEPVNALTQAFVRGLTERRMFGKLSWDVSTNHKVVFTATLDPQNFTNEGLDSLTAIETGYTLKQGGLNLLTKETAILSPDMFLETSVQDFASRPQLIPNLNADTNHNGILWIDNNNPHAFHEASSRDPGDENYTHDTFTLRTSGPYYQDFTGSRGRVTLRQDLTLFVPDWHGTHDMKVGGVVEREDYGQTLDQREELFPKPGCRSCRIPPTIGVALPTDGSVFNRATSTTFGLYFNDTYKPLPNLTANVGLRFDREATDSFGYTPFDPVAERTLYDNVRNISIGEATPENIYGNDDGIQSAGICSDPLLSQSQCQSGSLSPFVQQIFALGKIALSRLTQHHFQTALSSSGLATLLPGLIVQNPNDPNNSSLNLDILRQHGVTIEQKEPFRLTNNNLSPRLSVSWDPWSDSKTKLFANWSRFYDKLFLSTVVQEEGPDQILRYYYADPAGVDGIGPVITDAPPSAVQVSRNLRDPFSDEFTMGFERELAPEVSLKVTYINRQYLKQIEERDINHIVHLDPSTGQPLDLFGKLVPGSLGTKSKVAPDGRPDLYVENFFFNQIFREGNFAHARYRGIEVEVTKRLSHRWQLESSYTYSRAVGSAEEINSIRIVGDDAASIPYRFGYLDFDMRHVVKFNAVTFLPGGWEFAGVLSWHSGIPYSIIDKSLSLDNFGYPQPRTLFGRIVEGQNGPIFDPSRRNSQRNPAVYTVNVRGQKRLAIGHLNSKLFLSVDNLLNSDDVRISYYLPDAPDRNGVSQLISERRFGRRWEIGFQFDF